MTSAAYLDIVVRAQTSSATTSLKKLDATTKKSATAMKTAGQASTTFGRTTTKTAQSVAKVGTSATRAATGLDKYSRETKDADTSTRTLGNSLKSAAKWAAATAAAYVSISEARDAVNATTDLAKATLLLNKNLGLSVKTSSEFAAVAKARGVETRALGMSFGTLSKQIEAARNGSETSQRAFETLGISMKELKDASPGQVIRMVSDGMVDLGAGTGRTAATMTLFGRGWQTIAPILRDGSDAMQEQLDLANQYGASFSGKSVKSIEDLIAAQRELKIAQLGLQVQFTKEIAPALIQVGLAFARFINTLRKSKGEVKRFVSDVGESFRQFWDKAQILQDALALIERVFRSTFQNIVTFLRGIVKVISGVLTGNFSRMWSGIKDIFSSQVKGVLSILKEAVKPFEAAGKAIGTAIGTGFKLAWEGVKMIFEGAKNTLIGLVNWIISNVLNRIPGVDLDTIGSTGSTDTSHPVHGGGRAPETARHAIGGKVTTPMAIVGEEAPRHPEFVLATNPKYRQRNQALWAQAGNALGMPGFQVGGILSGIGSSIGQTVGGALSSNLKSASSYISDMGNAPQLSQLPKFMAGTGDWIQDQFAAYIRNKVKDAASVVTAGMTAHVGGPSGVGSYMGVPMANWVIESLLHAAQKGVQPQPTSGYRSHAYNVAQGRTYYSEHEGTQYPHGAVDFGGYVDPAAYANKMAVVRATRDFKWPLLAPIGFSDDGHASGTGHFRGGIMKYVKRRIDAFLEGGVLGRPIPAALQKWNRRFPAHVAPDYGGTQMPPDLIAMAGEFFGMPGVSFAQIAHGESNYRPGAVGVDPGGTRGYGLAQITTSYNDALASRYGGYEAFLNPIIAALGASKIWKASGWSPWVGTTYLTGSSTHWGGSFGELTSAAHPDTGRDRSRTRDDQQTSQSEPAELEQSASAVAPSPKAQKMLTMLAKLRSRTKNVQDLITHAEVVDAFNTSPSGPDLSPEERQGQVGLWGQMLKLLQKRRDLLKDTLPLLLKGGLKKKVRAELDTIQDITGGEGSLLWARAGLDALVEAPNVDVTATEAVQKTTIQDLLRFAEAVKLGAFGPVSSAVPYPYMGKFGNGGVALVGERGPELAHLPSGTRVTSPSDTQSALSPTIYADIYVGGEKIDERVEVVVRNRDNRSLGQARAGRRSGI